MFVVRRANAASMNY